MKVSYKLEIFSTINSYKINRAMQKNRFFAPLLLESLSSNLWSTRNNLTKKGKNNKKTLEILGKTGNVYS